MAKFVARRVQVTLASTGCTRSPGGSPEIGATERKVRGLPQMDGQKFDDLNILRKTFKELLIYYILHTWR